MHVIPGKFSFALKATCWGVISFSKMLIKHIYISIYGFISCLFLPFSVLVIRQLFPCIQTPTLPVSPRSISLLIPSKYQNSGRVCPLGHFDEILNSAAQRERVREGWGWQNQGWGQEVLKRFIQVHVTLSREQQQPLTCSLKSDPPV